MHALPAVREDLRDQLPGLEPERTITDWGRSERVEAVVDRVVHDFLYRYWFRVEVEGIENVPDEGGALLLANHAGAIPPDGAMIAKAIREEHPRPRPVHLLGALRWRRRARPRDARDQARPGLRPPGEYPAAAGGRGSARARVPGGLPRSR